MSIVRNRITAVAVGATIVVALGASGAVAAKLVTSRDIKDGTIRSVDIATGGVTGSDIRDGSVGTFDLRDGSVSSADIRDGSVGLADLSTQAKSALAPSEGLAGVSVDTLGAPLAITAIGGPINDNNTDLETGLTLPAGRYLVTVDGAFESATSVADAIDVYPQLSLWIDRNGDDAFKWQDGEGDISPNALMPDAANRHISVSGSTIIELDDETYVGLLAFGYASDQSSARSGEIDVKAATITATPLS